MNRKETICELQISTKSKTFSSSSASGINIFNTADQREAKFHMHWAFLHFYSEWSTLGVIVDFQSILNQKFKSSPERPTKMNPAPTQTIQTLYHSGVKTCATRHNVVRWVLPLRDKNENRLLHRRQRKSTVPSWNLSGNGCHPLWIRGEHFQLSVWVLNHVCQDR